MYCKHCGKELADQEEFCENCGTSVLTGKRRQSKAVRKKGKVWFVVFLAAAVLLVGVSMFIDYIKMNIDPTEYVTIEVSGISGSGTVEICFDENDLLRNKIEGTNPQDKAWNESFLEESDPLRAFGRLFFAEEDTSIVDDLFYVLTPIYSLMFDTAIKTALSRDRSEGNVYFITDEFRLLPNLEHIDDAVNTPTDCIYTMESQVCHNGDGILSILYISNYYMGGNHSIKNRNAVTYSLRTGEKVDLIQLTNLDESTLLSELQTRAYAGLETQAGPMLMDNAKDVLERYTLDDFEFLIQDGEIILLFDSYELTAAAAGPQSISTGLYITYL